MAPHLMHDGKGPTARKAVCVILLVPEPRFDVIIFMLAVIGLEIWVLTHPDVEV
jgi:hypothetical protein